MADNSMEPAGGRAFIRPEWLGIAVFAAAAVCTVWWLMVLGRGLTFFYDEWDFISAAATTGYWHNVLQPHNGHPTMVPFSVYEILLRTVGLRHYWPYRLLLVLLDVGCGWLLFVLLRRKIHPVLAGAAAAALMLLGPAWQDLLWPFQITLVGSVAGGLAALVLLDRDSTRADVGACACLVVSAACSGAGLPFLAGIGVELLWRRRDWRRLWVPAIPAVLFFLWYETIGKSSARALSLGTLVRSMGNATSTTVGALVGRGTSTGAVLSIALAVFVVVALVRSPRESARLAMAVTGLLTFWVLTLLARGVSPTSPGRYTYPAATFVLIGVSELPSLILKQGGAHRPSAAPWTRALAVVAMAGVVAYAGLAIWWNAGALEGSSAGLAGVSAQVSAELGAVALAGPALPQKFQPDPGAMPQVTVGPLLRAAADFGAPGDSRSMILSAGAGSMVDAMLLRGRPIEVRPQPIHSPTTGAGCVTHSFPPGIPALTFRLPPGGVQVTASPGSGLAVRARALSPTFPERSLATIPAGTTSSIGWSQRPSAITWDVQLTSLPSPAPGGSSTTICPEIRQ